MKIKLVFISTMALLLNACGGGGGSDIGSTPSPAASSSTPSPTITPTPTLAPSPNSTPVPTPPPASGPTITSAPSPTLAPTQPPAPPPTSTPIPISNALHAGTGVLLYDTGHQTFTAYANAGITPIKSSCPSHLISMDKRLDDTVIAIRKGGNELYEIDPYTATCKVIGNTENILTAITVADDNSIYGIDAATLGLWHLNSNGSKISYIPLTGDYSAARGIEFAKGKLIGTLGILSANAVFEITPSTGKTKLLFKSRDIPLGDIDIDEDNNLRGCIHNTTYYQDEIATIRLADGLKLDSIKTNYTNTVTPIVYKK